MRRKAAIAGIAAVAVAAAVGAYASSKRSQPWPPEWYIDATANQGAHLATWKRLRRSAVNSPNTDFPPNPAKLELLRFHAVAASSEPGESRPRDARVYFSDRVSANSVIQGASVLAGGASVYVLALRGKFTNANLRRPPLTAPRKGTSPMVILVFDAATMDSTDFYQGRERDLSALGESIELDLDQEPA